jgi:hypothetical protein
MKNAWIVACALLLVSAAGFAQVPSQAPLTSAALAAIFGPPPATGSCAAQQSGVQVAAKAPRNGLLKALCTATATCDAGTTISCEGNNSTTSCTAVDRNCDIGRRGHVTCDGVTTSCGICPCDDTPVCCRCERYGDCFSCCRCGGGSFGGCDAECNG